VLALTIRSIGEAATLQIGSHGAGFKGERRRSNLAHASNHT